MSNNFHQSVEEIVKAASPEQKILWNDIFLRFGQHIAVRQFVFYGDAVGTRLFTYDARTLYFLYEFNCYYESGVAATFNYVVMYDELNAAEFYLVTSMPYALAAVNYMPVDRVINNVTFSRIARSGAAGSVMTYCKGYVLGI